MKSTFLAPIIDQPGVHWLRVSVLMLLLASSAEAAGQATEPTPANATGPGHARVHDVVQHTIDSTLIALSEQGVFAAAPDSPLTVSSAPAIHYELGAVIDLAASDGDGLPVLAVTPGSSAERMGILAGDRFHVLNDLRLRLPTEAGSAATTAQAIGAAIAGREGAIELTVLRAGVEHVLHGRAQPITIPGYTLQIAADTENRCGRVSVFPAMARSERLFPLTLRRVDGVEIVIGPPGSIRVEPGRRRLLLSEAIPEVEFNSIELKQRTQLRNRRMAEFKTLEIDILPGFTYYLAAHLHDPPRRIIDNGYWQPVIWRIRRASCR
ncbi:MAG TPA: hypothetical protein DDZ76_13295 [Xanthomonadales bacterium]|nr:hypothetical protein [Xanthomonadales bacterium]